MIEKKGTVDGSSYRIPRDSLNKYVSDRASLVPQEMVG
jgi:hypothetical protein